MFTGDRSGDWLFRALHKAGFANQPLSESLADGLHLKNCYITATCRCAPPLNKLFPQEILNCRPFLSREIRLLTRVKVVIGLGKIGFDSALRVFSERLNTALSPRPRFAHGAEFPLRSGITILASFHPSQQNTFTGRLTEHMFDSIFQRAKSILKGVQER